MTNTILIEIIARALAEDIGTGDITTTSTVKECQSATGVLLVKQAGVISGLEVVSEVFRQVDPNLIVSFRVNDGDHVSAGTRICDITGSARSILTGERVALNFLQRMSGIATRTAGFVKLVEGTGAKIVDTRKTTPGLRVIEKMAVQAGGGHNHRMGLYDAVIIKDNHIIASGGITSAVARAKASISHTMTITVECETLDQVAEAIDARADILLLDNMDTPTLTAAAKFVNGRAITEASGGINESTAAEIAGCGVDILSIGALTHSAPALDISLDLKIEHPSDHE